MFFAMYWMDLWLKVLADQSSLLAIEDRTAMEDQVEQLRTQLLEREAALAAAVDEGRAREAEFVQLRKIAEHERNEGRGHLDDARKTLAQVERALTAERHERAHAQQEAERLRRELADAEAERDEALREHDRLAAELAAAKAAAEEAAAASTSRLDDLAREQHQFAAKLESVEQERAAAERQLAQARDAARQAQAGREALHAERDRLQSTIDALIAAGEQQRAESAGRLAEAQATAETARSALETAHAEQAASRATLDELRHALERKDSALTEARARQKSLESASKEAQGAADRRDASHRSEVARLTARIGELERLAGAATPPSAADGAARTAKGKKTAGASGASAKGIAAASADTMVLTRSAPVAASSDEAALVIGFHKPAGWSATVYLYYWNPDPEAATPAWPGVRMTGHSDGWYSHTLPGTRAVKLIFSDENGRQTGNLRRDRSGWLDADGVWRESKPD